MSNNLKGYLFSAVKAGIKKKDNPDLGLIISDTKASCACVFTKNAVKAAPVYLSMDRVKSGSLKGIIVNSGNANAATGDAGLDDARQMAMDTAHSLNIDEDDILVASTGVIGERLDTSKIKRAIPALVRGLAPGNAADFALAIMTTDTFPKVSERTISLAGKTVTVLGVAKGSGMIMPNMATMLGFLMTDANVGHQLLNSILVDCVNDTFNKVTVDGDTSTNDMVLIMANGESGADELIPDTDDARTFIKAVHDVMYDLSVMIAKDGEGATKFIKVTTVGAASETDAENVSRSIANSPLVKTAFFGEDANVGRLIMAVGNADAKIYPNDIDIYINDVPIVKGSVVTSIELRDKISGMLKGKEIDVTVDLNVGDARAFVITCDLSYDYVKINSEYTT
jgi:glutamate N-acetyltransferase/amino-acid N-acetyltransferase